MSDTLDFEQKIPISAMTEQRLHIFVLKHHLLDMRRAARFQYTDSNQEIADIYKVVKDVNKITTQGLFRLTKDSINYDNPVPGPNSLPDLDYAFLYVIPLTDAKKYVRQYTLIATDGHTTIKTRLGTYISSEINGVTMTILQWGKWRPYSDSNPMYELTQTAKAKVNETYLSFGDYELELPDPKLYKVGDVIRLDQWKGSGKVVQRKRVNNDNVIVKQINTYPAVLGTCKKIKCNGLTSSEIIFNHESDTCWIADTYTITIKLFDDIFHWVILKNGIVEYMSEESIFIKTSPTSATYIYLGEDESHDLTFGIIQTSNNSKDIWSCNTYEFEIFNDIDINKPEYNYWCVFILNYIRDPISKLEQFYVTSFNKVYEQIALTNARITTTSNTLVEYINTISAELLVSLTNAITSHQIDIEKYHPATSTITTI